MPTEKSNAVAWIVPHIAAFEKIMVIDKIEGYVFDSFISPEAVEQYRPGVNGFSFKQDDLLSLEEAILLLQEAQKVSITFLDELITQSPTVQAVEPQIAFERYLLNFSHETEHFGQLKYLLGTWQRTH